MKLSIITINYNNLEGLKRTYESVVSQTCQDFEWIIIDGGSTDGSKEFIEEHHDKFAYWCSEPDKGIYNAMNKGIAKAKGEYLNFMNSGDSFYDEYTISNVLSQSLTADLVYGDWIRVYPDREVLKLAPKSHFSITIFFENVCHQAMFIKSDVLKKEGYDERLKILADWKRWQKMSLDGQSFQYLPFIICRFEAGTGLSQKGSIQMIKDSDLMYEDVPADVGKYLRKKKKMSEKLWEYENNTLISETIRLSSQGRSYKTKLIHLNLLIIKILEKFLG